MIAQVPYATAEDVDRAARAAHAAFLKWREVPVVDRVQVLYRYKELLESTRRKLARILTTGERQDAGRRAGQRAAGDPDGGGGVRHAAA